MSKFDAYEHLNIARNADGSITRLLNLPQVKATGQTAAGEKVVSKDVVLNASNKTWLRIFIPTKLPSNDNSVARLPVILFFHGGGFILFSVQDPANHSTCETLSTEIPAIVIAVENRLAPEHRLPAPYEDAVESVQWVRSQAVQPNGDPWLKNYADFSRCYLYGFSSGGNIVFNAGIKLTSLDLEPVKIGGLIMNQPFLSGKQRTKSEIAMAADQFYPLPAIDLIWELTLPVGTDKDHRFCNPVDDGPTKEKVKKLPRSLVIGFGGDPMVDRQQELVQMLASNGVSVEARFDDVGFHGIDMIDKRRASAILNFVKEFV